MRLSEKGCVHLNEWTVHKLPMNAFVFKPEDFTDCVVLTIEEAKKLCNFLRFYYDFGTKKYEPKFKPQDGIDLLEKRIEQEEGKNG